MSQKIHASNKMGRALTSSIANGQPYQMDLDMKTAMLHTTQ